MKRIPLPLRDCAIRIGRWATKRRCEVVLPWLRGDVLDIGCGEGYLARFVSERQRYVGIDINEEIISSLKREYMNCPNREFWCVDVDRNIPPDLPLLNSTFDVIALLAVIEHLRNPRSVLSFSYRLLKNEGLLLITTPTSVGDKISSLIQFATVGTREPSYPHVRIFTRESLTALIEEVGFQVKTYRKFELGANQLFICSKRCG
ncbi:class I SAM-dependent methyltransferase [Dehalococcoidales bacterium]|nr:class I SAM-dependent methyltransferase [Dehalococcoidales bacterium]